ncbi:serine/threonine protein kinase [Minicystis rosea]|nr:serine/threonine protein kinase [Minicystis rosea]
MEQIGDYLVRRLIGEGGMGKVYEAEERLSKRRVALKVLHQELARSDAGRRLFLNEMQILAHLEHPNIVRSLASIEADGELVMVLEYLDGRTLRARLNAEGRFAWTDAIRIVADIAGALSAAHGQEPPIIHRDLKPENIMVLEGGAVKVMDFGIAKVIEALNQTNTQSVGTLQYMSPEQIDAHTIDHRSDLYCLGLIFYELLSGRPPFQSASPRQLLNLQCTAEPPPLPDDVRAGLPRGVEQLLFQLLEKAPEDRPYLAEDVIERLSPFQVAAPAKGGTRAPATPRTSAAPVQRTPISGDRRTPKPSSGGGGDAPAVSAPRSAEAASEAQAAPPKNAAPRADTIALLDRADAPREVPTRVAVGIIVALSALAGIAAYVLRAGSAPADTPATGPTAAVSATASFTRDRR